MSSTDCAEEISDVAGSNGADWCATEITSTSTTTLDAKVKLVNERQKKDMEREKEMLWLVTRVTLTVK